MKEKKWWIVGAAAIVLLPTLADARITRLDVVRLESPTFGGITFGSVGAYEKITARAFGEVDPTLPSNALITDIQFAPRNARGMVEYSTDVVIVKPIDPSKGSGKIFYDVVNRGNNLSYPTFNQAPSPSKLANTDAAGAGTGLLMRHGYTIVWSGWEDPAIIGTNANLLSASLPIARNSDGSSIVDKMIVEQIFDNATGTDLTLPFAAANLDQSQAYMVVHNHTQFVGGPLVNRVTVPTSVWSYVNNTTVRINRSAPFLAPYDQGAAFEFVFPAKDPIVEGLGFAATRDVISFLKHDTSTQNPVRNAIQWALGRGDSESGRYLKGFLYWGFNADENGQIVFDGMNPHISGAHAIAANDRFGDANATGRSYQRHLSAKMEFPFTYAVRTDQFTHVTDGILNRCLASNTCPKIMHTDSGNEPYLKPVSLVTTDGGSNGATPTDLVLPSNVRVYTIGSTQHGPASSASTTPSGVCQQPANPNQWARYVKALGIALDDWVTAGVPPPPSRYARVDDGTLVPTLPQVGQFPFIPGVTYTGWYNPVDVLDKSVLPNMPIPGESYTILVPKTDADGNDFSGIRTLDVQVPIATYTGWALRRAPFAANEDCALTGQYIPFAKTPAGRVTVNGTDPRPSVLERYPSFNVYYNAVVNALNDLTSARLLLCEDVASELDRLSQAGVTAGVPPREPSAGGRRPAALPVPSCM
jgi:Alpha/beta hydrolase domain